MPQLAVQGTEVGLLNHLRMLDNYECEGLQGLQSDFSAIYGNNTRLQLDSSAIYRHWIVKTHQPSTDTRQLGAQRTSGMGGRGKVVVYLTSPGHSTEIGLRLGKACYSWLGYGGWGDVFISSVFSLSFIFLFLPCPSLSSPMLSLLSLFSFSLGDDTKWSTRVDVSLKPNTKAMDCHWTLHGIIQKNRVVCGFQLNIETTLIQ